jgi:DNA ligase-1
MRLFTELFRNIDQTTSTNNKVAAMVAYFNNASDEDKLHTIAILTGNRPKRPVKTSDLKTWAAEAGGVPPWLFEECYYVAGDLAETIALILPPPIGAHSYSLHEILDTLKTLAGKPDDEKKTIITEYWSNMDTGERFVFNKLITGNFRMGVSRQLVVKALALYLHTEETAIAHRMMGKWQPEEETMVSLFADRQEAQKHYLPYPFFLAYPLEGAPETLGNIQDWIAEKKLDGIRGQIIVRNDQLFVWSRGEDLLTDKFPEFAPLLKLLPDGTVTDGEIIPWKDDMPLPFQVMQTRIGRKNLSAKALKDAPLVMVCYDLLEWQGKDIRHMPLTERRRLLGEILNLPGLQNILLLSADMQFDSWDEAAVFRANARSFYCEGLMLKRKDSVYETGRKRGNWWKWKTGPMTVDGVLLYAQSGHGRRANLLTDYTFAVWDEEGTLVPFAKAYSGLTDKEIVELNNWIRQHTLDKFGPVRSVQPELVFEIAFEGINASPRHKSGVALRFPRILRWRKDKSAKDANTKTDLLQLIETMNK